MRILHVWDVAGVTSILAKYQSKLGHDTKVIMLKKNDPMGVAAFYNKTYDMKVRKFIPFVIREAKNYDVIHIHNISEFLPFIKFRYPRKKVIIHHHGFTSSTKWFVKYTHKFADDVFIATKDLQQVFPDAKLIPTPIDTDHFQNLGTGKGNLVFHMKHLNLEKLKEHVKDVDIDIVDRDKTPVQYKDMPSFLRQYKTYYDIKYIPQGLGTVHSKTCYEALACGLDVVDFNGEVLHDLPYTNRPEYSASLCLKYYEE